MSEPITDYRATRIAEAQPPVPPSAAPATDSPSAYFRATGDHPPTAAEPPDTPAATPHTAQPAPTHLIDRVTVSDAIARLQLELASALDDTLELRITADAATLTLAGTEYLLPDDDPDYDPVDPSDPIAEFLDAALLLAEARIIQT